MASQLKNYDDFYETIFAQLEGLTPLFGDCGELCDKACCKGDDKTGMRLFPHEPSPLKAIEAEGGALAVCGGSCNRSERPLSCRIFPFFPTIDDEGRIRVKIDMRAYRLCPLAENSESIRFDKDFLRAVRRVGRLLSRDAECLEYLKETSEEIAQLEKLYGLIPKFSRRK